MNIHEIIHAWENNALPEDLATLALMEYGLEKRIEEYTRWGSLANGVTVMALYLDEINVYRKILFQVRDRINCLMNKGVGKSSLMDAVNQILLKGGAAK